MNNIYENNSLYDKLLKLQQFIKKESSLREFCKKYYY